jgi:hypothetical protein
MKNLKRDVARPIWIFLTAILLTTAAPVIESETGVDIGGSIGEESQRGFFLAVGDYYRVLQREVMTIKERGFPPYEVPVVLSLAKRAHVEPEVIMDLRLSGYTWLDITLRFGLNPGIFYVPVGAMVTGPPYGKAYGYYKKKPKKKWETIVLSDDDVINLVNLKFMSEHYGCPPEKIIKMRSGGKEFVSINDEIRKERKEVKEHGGK